MVGGGTGGVSDIRSISDEELDEVTSWSMVEEGGMKGMDGGRERGGGVTDRGGK